MEIRNLAVRLTRPLKQKDFRGEAAALFRYCRDDIRYVRDIRNVETLHDPVTLLEIGCGDCDDKSILLASLLLSIGARVRFIAVAFVPGQFAHVWSQVYCDGQWLDMEPTEDLEFGQTIPLGGVVQSMYQEAWG